MQDIAKEAEQAILALKKQNNGKIYLNDQGIYQKLIFDYFLANQPIASAPSPRCVPTTAPK